MTTATPQIFATNPASASVYGQLVAAVSAMGPFTVEVKKTCVHLVGKRAAFVGVHPRKQGLRLTIVTPQALEGSRIIKSDKASANRYHNEVDVHPGQVDDELIGWIREAYER